MRFTPSFVIVVAALCPIFVSAAPSARRAAAASDILVLKFADVLEQLEGQFYKTALAKFQDADFVAAGFPSSQVPIEQFQTIQQDEATHSAALEGVLKSLNEKPITSCKFTFDAVLKDVATMAAVARIVEFVGVGAYLGAAPLIKDPVILVAAGSILTVEARHQTILNVLSKNGTAIPSAFDIALTPNEVLSLASPFIDGPCDLGVQANPPLSITTNWTLCPGTKLTFASPALNNTNQDTAFCQMLVGGQPSSIALPLKDCVIPQGINGPVVIWITSDGQPLLNNVRDRATSQLIAGPTIAFVDAQPQLLGQLGRLDPSNPTPVTTTSTSTLLPAQISSAVGASSTQSSPPASTASAASASKTINLVPA
jgi:hypothetical protein